jgi:hypothetical protein
VIAFVAELQRAALQITRDWTRANLLGERVMTQAISSIDNRPRNREVED